MEYSWLLLVFLPEQM